MVGDNRDYLAPQSMPAPGPAPVAGGSNDIPQGYQLGMSYPVIHPNAAPQAGPRVAPGGPSAAYPGVQAASPNPLMQAALPPQPGVPPAGGGQTVQQPMTVPQQAGGRPAPAQSADSGAMAADDVIWVNRAKRAIMESRGDPHRQVQLIQHMRAQYLKQRFGRTVRTDEG